MRTLGIDFGTRRFGLALSDAGGKFATPYDVLEVSSPEDAMRQVIEIITKEGVERLVVGIPLNMDGTIGAAAQSTASWARALSSKVGKPLVMVDERLSSFDAEQQLISRKRGGEKITRAAKKQRLDALAAASFLQEYLDGKLSGLEMDQ